MPWSPRARVFWPILTSLLIADCTTKQLAETYLAPEHTPHEVAGSVVRFTLAHNSGAAMSLSLGRYSRIGFSLAALLALVVLVRLYLATPAHARRRAAALGGQLQIASNNGTGTVVTLRIPHGHSALRWRSKNPNSENSSIKK